MSDISTLVKHVAKILEEESKIFRIKKWEVRILSSNTRVFHSKATNVCHVYCFNEKIEAITFLHQVQLLMDTVWLESMNELKTAKDGIIFIAFEY